MVVMVVAVEGGGGCNQLGCGKKTGIEYTKCLCQRKEVLCSWMLAAVGRFKPKIYVEKTRGRHHLPLLGDLNSEVQLSLHGTA